MTQQPDLFQEVTGSELVHDTDQVKFHNIALVVTVP